MITKVDPETVDFYNGLAYLNMLGLPVDMAYFLFLNTAKDGNTEAFAQNTLIQIGAFGNLAISALGSLAGVLFNAFMQLRYWILAISKLFLQPQNFAYEGEWLVKYIINYWYEDGFLYTLAFVPFYSMFAMALPYAIYIVDVNF